MPDGSEKILSVDELLCLEQQEVYSICGCTFDEKEDLLSLSNSLNKKRDIYKRWSGNLDNISELFASTHVADEVSTKLSELSKLTGKSIEELKNALNI